MCLFFFLKKTGRVNPRGWMYDTPPQKIVGLHLCWVVLSFALWGRLQNFRPLGSFFLVEVEFLVGGWWCKVIIMSNPTRLRLGSGWVVVRLGFWQYTFSWIWICKPYKLYSVCFFTFKFDIKGLTKANLTNSSTWFDYIWYI